MTTEIAIMNKSAIALAADSAVTISIQGPQGKNNKVFNSANKLFSLSKCVPIGLMIYGNADLIGIPWETIIKIYREELGKKEFSTLSEHCDDFFNFLDNFKIEENIQEKYLSDNAVVLFTEIKDKLDKWVKENISSNPEPKNIKAQFEHIIKERLTEFEEIGKKSKIPEIERTRLEKKYKKTILDIAKQIFGELPVSNDVKNWLVNIIVNASSVWSN